MATVAKAAKVAATVEARVGAVPAAAVTVAAVVAVRVMKMAARVTAVAARVAAVAARVAAEAARITAGARVKVVAKGMIKMMARNTVKDTVGDDERNFLIMLQCL